jgi:hypothetical protein
LSGLAKLALDESERPKIDPDFEEATEGEEVERKESSRCRRAVPDRARAGHVAHRLHARVEGSNPFARSNTSIT